MTIAGSDRRAAAKVSLHALARTKVRSSLSIADASRRSKCQHRTGASPHGKLFVPGLSALRAPIAVAPFNIERGIQPTLRFHAHADLNRRALSRVEVRSRFAGKCAVPALRRTNDSQLQLSALGSKQTIEFASSLLQPSNSSTSAAFGPTVIQILLSQWHALGCLGGEQWRPAQIRPIAQSRR